MTHLWKKVSVLALAASVLAGCTAQNIEESSVETSETVSLETSASDQAAEIDIFVDNPNPEYTNVEVIESDSGAGEPHSYEELQEFFDSDKMNFFAFRILDVYPPEEAYEVTGDDIFTCDLTTLYKAVLTYDYLKNESVEIEVNIAKAGTPQKQYEGFPPYEIGGEYAAYFTHLDFCDSYQVACPELLFTLKSDGAREYALHPMFTTIDFTTAEATSLDLGIEGGEISVITSTSNNPVKYVHKYDIEELAEFFREDWTARGYTFKTIDDQECLTRPSTPPALTASGFEQVPALEQPEFVENMWLEEEEEVYYQRSAVIAKGHASDLAEYRVFGEQYDYYITALDFTLDEVFYGEGVSAGDTVSVGSYNSSYEYDSSLPTLKENGEYILFLHSTEGNEQIGDLVDYNMPSPLFNCIPVVGDYCETKGVFSDYGKSVGKSNIVRGRKKLAYEALQNGEDVTLNGDLVNESYSALAAEEAKYIKNQRSFEIRLSTIYVIRLSEFEDTLRDRVQKWK